MFLVPLHSRAVGSLQLHPEEESLLSPKVSAKRRNGFILGRAAARLALRRAGCAYSPAILQGPDREPLWPAGFAGSITHCGEWAVAAVAAQRRVRAIGIDLEDVDAVQRGEIAETVCSEAELKWVADTKDSPQKLAMIFSAKESIYKALNPLCHRFFDFHDVELAWSPQRARFEGTLRVDLERDFPAGFQIQAGCQTWQNLIFTHALIAAPTI
ncbi:MAG: 4'-phosphopantetheinyl transferase superfamily protein [Candidatus Acidiferrales bacterium]